MLDQDEEGMKFSPTSPGEAKKFGTYQSLKVKNPESRMKKFWQSCIIWWLNKGKNRRESLCHRIDKILPRSLKNFN
jgi:DNA-binding HxlR family transcriptional regulator